MIKLLREISPALATRYIRALPKSVRSIEQQGKEAVAKGNIDHDWVKTFKKLGNRAVGGKRAARRAMNESPASISPTEFEKIKQTNISKGRGGIEGGERFEGKKNTFQVRVRIKPGTEKKQELPTIPDGYVKEINPHNGTVSYKHPSVPINPKMAPDRTKARAADVLPRRSDQMDKAKMRKGKEPKKTGIGGRHVAASFIKGFMKGASR